MINFKPLEWIKIEAANQFGWDKKHYSERINLGSEIFGKVQNIGVLETFKQYDADEPELFLTALYAMDDYINHRPSGIPVRADAANSGAQLLSVLMKCSTGMKNTGSLGTEVPDVYTTIYNKMKELGAPEGLTRKQVKKGTIPYVYGSQAVPKKVFGEYTDMFFDAYFRTIPAANMVSDLLIDAWNSNVEEFKWELPDGFIATTTPTALFKYRIPFGLHSLTYLTREKSKADKGAEHTKALSANVTHSYDAYVLRELHRRCNYNPQKVLSALNSIDRGNTDSNIYLEKLEENRSNFNQFSYAVIDAINRTGTIGNCSDTFLKEIKTNLENLLKTESFEVMSIHDEFMCLPNHMNQMKKVYNQILAESYLSHWLIYTVCKMRGDTAVLKYIEEPKDSIYEEILNAPYTIS